MKQILKRSHQVGTINQIFRVKLKMSKYKVILGCLEQQITCSEVAKQYKEKKSEGY